MKKCKVFLPILLTVFLLWGCGTSHEAENVAGKEQTEKETTVSDDLPEAETDGTNETGEIVADENGEIIAGENGIGEKTGEDVHTHHPSEEDNIVVHEPTGYCGNTVTTIRRHPGNGEESWEKSFWGDDSVALTDLLLYLDYKDDICKCMPEYTMDTEFGEGYGINLTESYARYGDKQTALTEEQVKEIREIIERVSAQTDTPDAGTDG